MATERCSPRRPLSVARALSLLGGAATLTLAATPAAAMDTFFVGARGQGMAGALTASVDDTDAQYYNPAAFGFFNKKTDGGYQTENDNNNLGRKDFGFGVDVGAGARVHGNMYDYADTLADLDLNQFDDGIDNAQEAGDLLNLTSSLAGVGEPGNAVVADVNAGTSFRAGHYGLGFRTYGQAAAWVNEVDTANLGTSSFDFTATDVNNELDGVTFSDTAASDGSIDTFSTDQQQALSDAGITDSNIDKLDYAAESENLSDDEVQQAVDLIVSGLNGDTTLSGVDVLSGATSGDSYQVCDNPDGTLDCNSTSIFVSGFALAEVPLTYGYALNDHWSIGGNLKFMRGRVYGNHILVFDDNNDEVIAKTDEKYEESTNFGVDLGIMARYDMFNFGVMARNLNAPTFDGFRDPDTGYKYDDVTVEPQARVGFAFIPHETFTLEADYDVTANETALTDYRTQFLSGGFEWDAFRFLALRAGAYKNLAEDDIGLVYTAGLGLNLWAVRVDVGAAMSKEEETVDGEDVPKELRANAEITVDF